MHARTRTHKYTHADTHTHTHTLSLSRSPWSGQVRTTMRFYPGGMGGMGQSAADNVAKRGSSLDEWQVV